MRSSKSKKKSKNFKNKKSNKLRVPSLRRFSKLMRLSKTNRKTKGGMFIINYFFKSDEFPITEETIERWRNVMQYKDSGQGIANITHNVNKLNSIRETFNSIRQDYLEVKKTDPDADLTDTHNKLEQCRHEFEYINFTPDSPFPDELVNKWYDIIVQGQ